MFISDAAPQLMLTAPPGAYGAAPGAAGGGMPGSYGGVPGGGHGGPTSFGGGMPHYMNSMPNSAGYGSMWSRDATVFYSSKQVMIILWRSYTVL